MPTKHQNITAAAFVLALSDTVYLDVKTCVSWCIGETSGSPWKIYQEATPC